MSNVFSIAWRFPCALGLRASSTVSASSRIVRSPLLPSTFTQRSYSLSPVVRPPASARKWQPHSSPDLHRFPGSANTVFSRSAKTDSKPKSPVGHGGVPTRWKPLAAAEIGKIFGPAKISPDMGNRILRGLQERRLAGTLDQPLPADITRVVKSRTVERGLHWLRENHPMDEDAAIMARIEQEEREEEERLYRHAEAEGLYRPQSGHWGAQLGDGDDIYGKSVLKEFREKNEARLLAEEEVKRKEWIEGEAKDREKVQMQLQRNTELQKYTPSAVVEARPRADPKERPFLAWTQKHYLRAENNDTDFTKMTTARRLLPALGLTIITLGLCYIFANTYQPPQQHQRMWPDIPPAAATVIAIMGINTAIFGLWKIPPAWRILNRYFISVPLYPYALSVVGSIFSHQQLRHFATNTIILWLIGLRLHDEIGRGNFLAVYLASGVFGSMTSLTSHVLLNKLTITSLGASGAIAGLVAAWCMLHSNDKLVPTFLPREWRESVSARGSVVLAGIVAFELFNLVSPFKVARLDHWAHLGGYCAGAAWAVWWKSKRERTRQQQQQQQQGGGWLDRVIPRSR